MAEQFIASPLLPRAGEGRRGGDGYLVYLLRQANVALRQAMDRGLAAHDLTLPQYSTLVMISSYPIISSADLARLTLLTPQSVSVIVANLVRRGAIARRPDPVHKRIQRLELTAMGQDLLAACRAHSDAVEETISSLFPGDPAALKAWLSAVATTLDESDPRR